MTIKHYLNVIKPNIVIGNATSSIGGFFMASPQNHINISLFVKMIIGISLITAASCIFNNIIDRDIDAIMSRTMNRILAKKQTTTLCIQMNILLATILIICGFYCLSITQNMLLVYLTAVGVFIYIGIYSLWMKRNSIYSIIIGSLAGSIPPVLGYCTVTHTIDIGAIILFIMFSLWQIPHSYAIIISTLKDYEMASIPTFPGKKGIYTTICHMLVYIIGFSITTTFLTITKYTGYTFLLITTSINLLWIYIGLQGFKYISNHGNITLWAKKIFLFSIIVIISINILLSLDNMLSHILL